MWEKTHEGLMEERERRRRAREEAKEHRGRRAGEAETEREAFDRMVEESLRRGRERKTNRREGDEWREAWKRYLDSWERLNELARGEPAPAGQPPQLRNLLVWPVKSGKRKDVTSDAVWEFMRNAPLSAAPTPADDEQSKAQLPRSTDFLVALKAERVRWHPDKMQHRYGMLGIEDGLVKGVTEVFQFLDRLWVEQRSKMGDS
jgi:hypothetical protein